MDFLLRGASEVNQFWVQRRGEGGWVDGGRGGGDGARERIIRRTKIKRRMKAKSLFQR